MLKKTGKFLLWFLLGVIGYFALYFLFTFIFTIIPVNTDFQETEDGIDTYIISNGVHTDICFPVAKANLKWNQILDFNNFQNPDSIIQYLSIGWGDKGFYFDTPSWAELTAKTALRAAFLPTPTAIHVSALKQRPTLGEKSKKVRISNIQLKAIEDFIFQSFQHENGSAKLIDCCRYEGYDDNFYEAEGYYHMLRTCNVWANQAIKAGGIKTALWAPFDKCILYHF